MLKGISPLISPELITNLLKMGHGDEIILADAHFPGYTFNQNVIRADGLRIADLLKAILPLMELDTYVDNPIAMMAAAPGDELDPAVEESYMEQIAPIYPYAGIERMERFDFYERTKEAFVVVITGETAKYGNILLKKGVTPQT